MKKILLFALAIGSGLGLMAQISKKVPKEALEYSVKMYKNEVVSDLGSANPEGYAPVYDRSRAIGESDIGESVYDLQSNDAVENRVYRYEDGTMAAVWTMGMEDPSFPGRGTGYNYFDGSEWMDMPTERIENERVGWPSYAPLGDNGELVVAHTGLVLKLSTRENKGTGDWEYQEFAGPEGQDILWPRVTTNGNTIHMVGALPNVANGGSVYEGLDGAIVYSRSTDGGETWVDENILLPGIDSDTYLGINADEYVWAQRGDVIALAVTSNWYGHDTFIIKSEDNGETWEKTVVWENPYNLVDYDNLVTEDTISAPDGTLGATIDSEGNVHLAFGLSRAYKEETGSGSTYSIFPFVEGIVYWNETMPPFTAENQHDALWLDNLVEDETYIAGVPDVNNDGEYGVYNADIETQIHQYRGGGLSTMPSLMVDEHDNVFVTYSTMMEDENSTSWLYRHIWTRAYSNYLDTWNEAFDATGDPIHTFDECLYPQMFNILPGDDKVRIMYQRDNIVGLALNEDDPQSEYTTNTMGVLDIDMADYGELGVSINDVDMASQNTVSQNYPNPFSSTSTVEVELAENANLSMEVVNLVGQTVQRVDKGSVKAGTHTMQINAANLETGVYFYNVNINDETVTKKMVVK